MSPLFVPGPVDVPPEVLAAQDQPMVPHRSPHFEDIFHRSEGKMRQIFRTAHRVFITASSGTGLQEAAVRNLANESVLACVNGAFGKRWYDVAVTNGKQADPLEFGWQEPVDPGRVAEALKAKHYEVLTVVHNETSTGLMNPVEEIAAAARQASPDTLVCVDAVSSLSGARMETDAWGLDLVLSSSQKCLALPPGLGFAAVSDRALARAESVANRGWYFDLVRLEKHRTANSTPATPAVSLIYALDVQTKRILAEGVEARWARHSALASRTADWAQANGFDLYAPAAFRSQTVTTIQNSRSVDVPDLNQFLQNRGMRIAGGYGPLKASTFRIGHMGELTEQSIDQLFEAVEEYLNQ